MSNPVITQTAPQWAASGSAVTTVNVAPFNVGDLMVAAFYANHPATGMSGGGVPSWTLVSSYFDTTANFYISLWWGVVATAGASTVTVTDTSPGFSTLWVREFMAIAPVWSCVTASPAPGTSGGSGASGTAITFPSLSPSAGGNDLYVGVAWSYFTHANLGTTAGFIFGQPASNGFQLVAYDPSVSSLVSPSSTSQGSSPWLSAGAVFTAGGGTLTAPAYATAYSVLGGGSGSWVNPQNATGPPTGSYATWTAP